MLSSLKHNKKVVIVPFLPRPLISVESMLEQLSEIEKILYVVEKNLEMLDNFDKVNDVHDDVLKWTKLQETTRKLPKTQLSNEVVGESNDGNEVLTECELRNKKRRFAETMAETTPTTTPPPKKRKKSDVQSLEGSGGDVLVAAAKELTKRMSEQDDSCMALVEANLELQREVRLVQESLTFFLSE